MNRADIIRMAREAGGSTDEPSDLLTIANLERFAVLVAAALKMHEQEPVAWMVYTLDGKSVCVTDSPSDFADGQRALPLFTLPISHNPLTDEMIVELWSWSMTADAERTANTQQHAFARAIERAHGIGGGDEPR